MDRLTLFEFNTINLITFAWKFLKVVFVWKQRNYRKQEKTDVAKLIIKTLFSLQNLSRELKKMVILFILAKKKNRFIYVIYAFIFENNKSPKNWVWWWIKKIKRLYYINHLFLLYYNNGWKKNNRIRQPSYSFKYQSDI